MLRTNDFPGISRWSNGRRRQLNKRLLSGRQLLSSLFCILKKDSYFRGGGYTFEFILHLEKRRLLSGGAVSFGVFCIYTIFYFACILLLYVGKTFGLIKMFWMIMFWIKMYSTSYFILTPQAYFNLMF